MPRKSRHLSFPQCHFDEHERWDKRRSGREIFSVLPPNRSLRKKAFSRVRNDILWIETCYTYLNLIAFTGLILLTRVDGMMSTSKVTSAVPTLSNMISDTSNCIGTNFI